MGVHAIIAVAALLPGLALGAKPYTREDLEALAKSESWAELVEHATDLAPTARDKAWEALVTSASSHVLKAAASAEVLATLDKLTTRFPFLKKTPEFQGVRDVRGLEALEACFATSKAGQECLEKVEAVAGGNSALTFKAAKLAMRAQFPYVPAPLFRKALENASTTAQCEDDDLGRCVKAALALPHAEPRAADARALLEGRCAKELIDYVEADLRDAKSGSDFARNACPGFKKAKALPSPNPCGN